MDRALLATAVAFTVTYYGTVNVLRDVVDQASDDPQGLDGLLHGRVRDRSDSRCARRLHHEGRPCCVGGNDDDTDDGRAD